MKLATQVRSKPASKAPVTKHPLFPAMVALWFGALFGLGSLAVRASLLESLVLSLSLDVLLPAAAPPLGMKFRLIIALLLAAIGVALGAVLARRIARPKQVQAPRRRGIGSKMSGRQARGGGLTDADETATRRRPLTVAEDQGYDRHYEAAPLPGGSPAILDVTRMDIAPAEDQVLEPLAAEVEAPLALDAFVIDEPVHTGPAPMHSVAQAALDNGFGAEPQATQPERQMFRPAEPAPAAAVSSLVEEPQPVALNFHPPVDATVPPQEAPLDLLAEQEVAPAGQIPAEPEADEYAQLVEQLRRIESPVDGHSGQPAPAEWTGEPPAEWTGEPPVGHAQSEPEAASLEVAIDSGSDQVQWSSEPLPVVPPVLLADPLPLAAASPAQVPMGNRIQTAELSTLSPVELIERLAQAMRQRAHQGEMPESLVAAVSSLAAPLGAAVTMPVELPVAEAAPIANQLDQLPQLDELVIELPEETPLAPVSLALPSALRPIDFSDYADDDDDIDNVSLPPRSFAVPSVALPAIADLSPPEPEAAGPGEAPVAADDSEAEVPEESYSSLLELGRPAAARQDFVRIEEPEEDSATIEPVVIFPGHGARTGVRFAAPDPASQSDQANPATESAGPFAAAGDGDAPQLRRFDPPSAVASSGPSAHAGGLRQDPEEAQRALRSALATLQRMSGAA